MSNQRLQSAEAESMTAEEAEQVMQLWTERTQGIPGHLTLYDVAEALGTTATEVEDLLRRVRYKAPPIATAVEVKPAKKRWPLWVRIVLWAFAIQAVWLIGYASGESRTRSYYYGPNSGGRYAGSPGPTNAPIGYTVSFDGYVAKGSEGLPQIMAGGQTLQGRLEECLHQELDEMSPSRALGVDSLADSSVEDALESNQEIKGVLAFRLASVTHNKITVSEKIPVPLTNSSTLMRLVPNEQDLRIRRLASRAAAGIGDASNSE